MKIKIVYNEYSKFHASMLRKSRYAFEKRTLAFLEYLYESSSDKILNLSPNQKLFRTQRGHDEIEEDYRMYIIPYKKDRMIPKAEKTRNGRVNPIGIPVLYLSDDPNTAISETRPWVEETISLATFNTNTELKLLDLTKVEIDKKFYFKEPKDKELIAKKIWSDVSMAFSKPVTIDEQDTAYIPTQVIGEYFKIFGFDGICYKSLLGKGNNYALFNLDSVEIQNGVVMIVKSIKINTEQYGNPVKYTSKSTVREYNVVESIEAEDKK